MSTAFAFDQNEPAPETSASVLVAAALAPSTEELLKTGSLPRACKVCPLVRSNWLLGTLRPMTRLEATTTLLGVAAVLARTSQMAGVVPLAPTMNTALLEMRPPR